MNSRTKPLRPVSGFAVDGLGAALRVLVGSRARQRLTGRQMAERLGVSAAVVSRLERGGRSPSFNMLQRYAQALGHDVCLVVLDPDGRSLF